MQPVLIAGRWRPAHASQSFRADNPRTREPLPDEYPVSSWADCDEALAAAVDAARALAAVPREPIAKFLERFAERIETRREALILRLDLGFRYREIAEAMGLASGNAARLLASRAFLELCRSLKDR